MRQFINRNVFVRCLSTTRRLYQHHDTTSVPHNVLLMIRSLQASSTQPTIDQLDRLTSTLHQIDDIQVRAEMSTLTNSLQSAGFYDKLPYWARYKFIHQPHITNSTVEDYTLTTTKLMTFLREIDDKDIPEDDLSALQKLLRPDVVQIALYALSWGDQEYAMAFIDLYVREFGIPLVEDWHTWLYEALESGSHSVVAQLVKMKGMLKFIPDGERLSVLKSLIKSGEVHVARELWDPEWGLRSFEVSVLVEMLAQGDIITALELIEYASVGVSDELDVVDFRFMVDQLKDELKQIGDRRRLESDNGAKTGMRDAEEDVRRPDFVELLSRYDVFNERFDPVTQTLFANILLTLAADVTNTTGVIFVSMNIPFSVFDSKSFEILLHCCSRGNDGSLRAFQLFQQACDRDITLTQRCYTSLFKISSDSYEQLLYYLGHFFKNHSSFSSRTHNKLNTILSQRRIPDESRSLIRSLLSSRDPEDAVKSRLLEQSPDFLREYHPIDHKTYYDLRESLSLSRHLASTSHGHV